MPVAHKSMASSGIDWSSSQSGGSHAPSSQDSLDDAAPSPGASRDRRSRPSYDPKMMSSFNNGTGDITDLVAEDSSDDSEAYVITPTRRGSAWLRLIGGALALVALAGVGVGIGIKVEGRRQMALVADPLEEPQRLLEIAERVVLACDARWGDEDQSECRYLCEGSMCCVDGWVGTCADDSFNCAVYAGCTALLSSDAQENEACCV